MIIYITTRTMRTKRLLTLLMAVYGLTAHAQDPQMEYRPFVVEGKTWETQVGGILENSFGNRIDGDTLIGGNTWKKVYNYFGLPEFDYTYYAAVRDVGQKVYAIAKGGDTPRLLYDFGLEKGSIVKCGVEGNAFGCLLDDGEQPDTLLGFQFNYYLRVEQIDTIEAFGSQYRRFKLTMLDFYKEPFFLENEGVIIGNIVWVEGVGSGAGPFSPWLPLPPSDLWLFRSCCIGSNCISGYSLFYQDDDATEVDCPPCMRNGSSGIYNLQGQRMRQPTRGVYIQGGKKHLKKP